MKNNINKINDLQSPALESTIDQQKNHKSDDSFYNFFNLRNYLPGNNLQSPLYFSDNSIT